MKKKMLFLGGGSQQIPAIQQALEEGYYIISCGFRPDDPGHKLTHEFHGISTVDFEAVLQLARSLRADLVVSYASDAAAPVAALVSEKLGLPGNPYSAVKLMTEKDLFRNFQLENGFFCPKYKSFTSDEIASVNRDDLHLPVIIKPIDSSGSRGVVRLSQISDFTDAVDYALNHSLQKRCIVEEVIETEYPQVTGDGFVVNGRLKFLYLGDHQNEVNSEKIVATSTTWPSRISRHIRENIETELDRIVDRSGYENGPVNVDVRIGLNNQVYIIDIAPRNGANFVPQLTQLGTGVDLIKCYFDILAGRTPEFRQTCSRYVANYIIHSKMSGVFDKLVISPALNRYLTGTDLRVKRKEKVNGFHHLADALGVLLLSFENEQEMKNVLSDIDNLIHVRLISS